MSCCRHASASGHGCNNNLNNLNDKLFPVNLHSYAISYAAKISASLYVTCDSK